MAYLAVEKDDMSALLLTDAVAPVKMRVGGYCADLSSAVFKRRGNTACEKRKAPLLKSCQHGSKTTWICSFAARR